jgi:hypothetical protein
MIFRCCAFAAAALLIALSGTASADLCVTAADVTARIEEEIPGASIAWAEGPVAYRIGIGMSSVTGDVLAPGGSYVRADLPAGALTYIVRIASGCATHHGRFPRQLVRTWIAGQAAENQGHE